MYKNHILSAIGKTQADGAQTLGNAGYEFLPNHQIQIEVSAQPSAGTLKVEYRTPGATEYVEATGSPVDLTALNKATAFRLDNVFVDSFRFTPDGFDADKMYNVIVAGNE